jgi:hypothetical protein
MSDNEKPLAKFLRLQNGDDVIAEVVETEDEQGILYTLFHPLKLVYVPAEDTGYVSIAFMPWVFPRVCEEQIFSLHAEDVMLLNDITQKMNIYYWESVESYLNMSKKIEEESEPERHPDTDMTPDEELELYNKIVEHLGTKRTYH